MARGLPRVPILTTAFSISGSMSTACWTSLSCLLACWHGLQRSACAAGLHSEVGVRDFMTHALTGENSKPLSRPYVKQSPGLLLSVRLTDPH